MSDYKDSLFKDHYDLQLFFKSEHILFHNILEYFKDKGIFAFAHTNDDMANFACNFFMGVESQENLRKYIDVKAFPKISGFILKNSGNISLENLKDCLNSYQGNEFRDIKNAKLIHVSEEYEKLTADIEYYINDVASFNIFDTIKRNATFEVLKLDNNFLISMILNRDSDYSVSYGIINTIINENHDLKLKLIEHDLSKIPITRQRHNFFINLISELNKKYEIQGIIKYDRNRAKDLDPEDLFERRHLRGNHEIDMTDINDLIANIEARGALLERTDIVVYQKKSKELFVMALISKDDKRKIEVGISDIKYVDNSNSLEKISNKIDISKLESANLSEFEKREVLNNVWGIVSKTFYEYREHLIGPMKFSEETEYTVKT